MNYYMDFLSEEIEQDILWRYQSLCDDLTQKLGSMQQEIEELCNQTQFEPMVKIVNENIVLFNHGIYSVASQTFDEWIEGADSLVTAAEDIMEGDIAEDTARQIEQSIRDIFDGFWSSHPMGDGVQLDTSKPKIKGGDFDELKEIYTRFFQDIESTGKEVVNQIAEQGSENLTYEAIIPAFKAITEPMKNAFEQLLIKVDKAKEDNQNLKQQLNQTAIRVENERCVEKNEVMSCRYCGAEMLSNTKFCIKCGKNNGEEIQTNTKRIKTEAREQEKINH